jgi:hypothetical protein
MVNLSIDYPTLIELVNQLPEPEQQDLLQHLLKRAQHTPLTTADRMRLLRAVQIRIPLNEGFLTRREDLYDDGE